MICKAELFNENDVDRSEGLLEKILLDEVKVSDVIQIIIDMVDTA